MNSDIVVFTIIASGALLLCLSLFFSRNQKKGKAHKHHFEKLGGVKNKKCPRCGTSCKPIYRGQYWDNTSKPYVEYNCQNCGCFFTNNE